SPAMPHMLYLKDPAGAARGSIRRVSRLRTGSYGIVQPLAIADGGVRKVVVVQCGEGVSGPRRSRREWPASGGWIGLDRQRRVECPAERGDEISVALRVRLWEIFRRRALSVRLLRHVEKNLSEGLRIFGFKKTGS